MTADWQCPASTANCLHRIRCQKGVLRHLEIPEVSLNLQVPLLRLTGRHARHTSGSFQIALPSGDKHAHHVSDVPSGNWVSGLQRSRREENPGVKRHDWDAAQLYKHGYVHVMKIGYVHVMKIRQVNKWSIARTKMAKRSFYYCWYTLNYHMLGSENFGYCL